MTSKLRCPFCKEEIISDVCCVFNEKNKDYTSGRQIYKCNKCSSFGNKELWQALIQSLKDRKELAIKLTQTNQILDLSEKCCSAWETQALDYKAETIALSGKLEIATKALKDINMLLFSRKFDITELDRLNIIQRLVLRALRITEHKEQK